MLDGDCDGYGHVYVDVHSYIYGYVESYVDVEGYGDVYGNVCGDIDSEVRWRYISNLEMSRAMAMHMSKDISRAM